MQGKRFQLDVTDQGMDLLGWNLAASCGSESGGCVRRVSLLIGLASCLALHAVAGCAQSVDDARIDLRISEGLLTLKADDVALGAVLQRIAQALSARLSMSADAAARIGHWDLRQVPVEEAVTQIAPLSNIVVVLDPESAGKGKFLVREIYLLGDSAPDSKIPVQTSPALEQRIRELAGVLASEVDSNARRTAAAVLGDIGGDESVGILDRSLGDVDPGVRVKVVESLGRIGTDEAIRLVGQAAMGSRDPNVIDAATRVLEASTSDRSSVMLAAIKSRAQPGSPSPH
jgi:HEAT repeats